MTPRFHAHRVDILETPTYRLVGFADRTSDTADYLMLQRGLEDDEQDIALGLDTYYVERRGEGSGGYGGIAKFELHRDRAHVTFTDEGARRMDDIAEMEITFHVDDATFRNLHAYLEHVLAGAACYRMDAACETK
jgi:hypothetical protein